VDTAHADEPELGPRQVEAVPECNIEDRVDVTQPRQFDGEMVQGVELVSALEVPRFCHRGQPTDGLVRAPLGSSDSDEDSNGHQRDEQVADDRGHLLEA
jgi:hypothetical protein